MKKVAAALGVIAVLLGGFAAYVSTLPSSFQIQRSRTIAAAPDVVFPLVANLQSWPRWSPWAELDPTQKTTYGGPAEGGVGQTSEWSGNDKVGKGKMTVVASRPPEKLELRLEFIEPFAAVNQTSFELARAAAGTKVTWTMTGKNDFMGKLFSVFMNMDQMVGADFEKGLAKLETVAVAEAKAAPAPAPAGAATPEVPAAPAVPVPPTGG